jgi:hypothetical protein
MAVTEGHLAVTEADAGEAGGNTGFRKAAWFTLNAV